MTQGSQDARLRVRPGAVIVGLPERVQRLRRADVDAAVGERRRRVGVLAEVVDRHRPQIAAGRDHDDRAGLAGEEDVAVGGDGDAKCGPSAPVRRPCLMTAPVSGFSVVTMPLSLTM